MTETVVKTGTGAIIVDRTIISEIDDERFTRAGWLHAEPVDAGLSGAGRGTTLFVGNVPRQFVLRHYLRGGLVGNLVHDSYLWLGEDRTRPFAEWRLLAKMAGLGLRVPRPAAARYCRRGPVYTADLITVRIPNIRSLAECVNLAAGDEGFWRYVGVGIQEFHASGVCHADMNAYNLQIDDDGRLWMLDFDRGRLLPPGPWQPRTLRRLHRSLEKIKRLDPGLNFTERDWEHLLQGYFEASRSA